jgi:hypothetical protein
MTQSQWRMASPGYAAPSYQRVTKRRRPWGRIALFVLVVAALLGGIGYGVYKGIAHFSAARGGIPRVMAPEGPYKIRPEGAVVKESPHKDKTIYDQLGPNGTKEAAPITLRARPAAPVEAPPALPDDFIKALSQSPVTGQDLEAATQEVQAFEGAQEATPFAERDGFFKEIGEPKKKESGVTRLPAAATAEASTLPIEGRNLVMATGEHMCLEFCVAPTKDGAEASWHECVRKASDLLATHSPTYHRVDHGRKNGIHYHLRLGGLTPDRAVILCEDLRQRGVQVWVLPE